MINVNIFYSYMQIKTADFVEFIIQETTVLDSLQFNICF